MLRYICDSALRYQDCQLTPSEAYEKYEEALKDFWRFRQVVCPKLEEYGLRLDYDEKYEHNWFIYTDAEYNKHRVPQTKDNGISKIIGEYPGNETDEEIKDYFDNDK